MTFGGTCRGIQTHPYLEYPQNLEATAMPRQIVPLTDVKIKSAKAKGKSSKLFDGGGLFLLITPTGGKLWRLKYRFGGTEKLLSLGSYPQTSLTEARQKRTRARSLLEKGVASHINWRTII